MFNSTFLIVMLAAILIVGGCSSTTKVTRVNPDSQIDLSGDWNDYDAQLVSKEMIEDVLSRGWLDKFLSTNNRNPVVIVGRVANRSMEHIDTQIITKNIEREFVNSHKVSVVASSDERSDVRDEREDQQMGWTDPATIKQIGKEKGADYMLIGSINSIKDELKNKAAVYYQFNMELIDITTNEKVWIGQKEIKKKIERSKYSM